MGSLEGVEGLASARRFRTEEYHRLITAGILDEDEHVELLEGVIVEMTPQKRPHARVITTLTGKLARALPPEYSVRIQLPLTLSDDSEPEPDLAVVLQSEEDAAPAHPRSALLVAEVSGDSLRKDRSLKGRVYARANIPEYWIANVAEKCVEIYTDPVSSEGRYATARTVRPGDTLVPRHLPGVEIPVADLFA
ncbi:MAG: Uma2 family endonuclease [Myxococcales bacterium]|nr:Uma2 family endonuclease [Myxococcales bacterium]